VPTKVSLVGLRAFDAAVTSGTDKAVAGGLVRQGSAANSRDSGGQALSTAPLGLSPNTCDVDGELRIPGLWRLGWCREGCAAERSSEWTSIVLSRHGPLVPGRERSEPRQSRRPRRCQPIALGIECACLAAAGVLIVL